MKRRNFIKNAGLGIAGLTLSNGIYGKNLSTKKSLNIFILMSGGLCLNDIIEVKNNPTLKLFNEYTNIAIQCKTNVNYTGQCMEHANAMLAVLGALKDDSVKNIFISNVHSEVTLAVKNSFLPLSVIDTNSQGILDPYRNDAAVFEKAYQYFDQPHNFNLILNLEDTDIAHYSKEDYEQVLKYYSFQINKLCKFLYAADFRGKCNTSISVASVLGRNNFENEIYNELNQGGTDHYDSAARALFSLSMSYAAASQISFDHSNFDSKDLLSSSLLVKDFI
jgi:hypothetical protein